MPAAPLTIGVVAGEASGDQLGAHLIKSLRARLPQAHFSGIGGPRMQAEGMEVLHPMEKLAVRGYVEVLRHYLELVRIRRDLAAHFLRRPPALFVGVDAPDFNLALEARLKAAGVPTIHYVSPQIWAWRGNRIHRIKRAVDRMLVVFPFEEQLYERAGVPVTYVGHPLAEMLEPTPDRRPMRDQLRLPAAARIVAMLPGSRDAEVEHLAGVFIETAARIAAAAPETHFLVPLVSRRTRELFEAELYARPVAQLNLTVLFGHAHDAMTASDVVLAASGTATLEAALIGRPVVIAYRMPRVSWWLLKTRPYQPYVGLPNVVAGEFVVPEFLQDEATPDNLAQAVLNLLYDSTVRARLESRFAVMAAALRRDSRSLIASALVPMVKATS